ncbi:PREDICTED: uncharacterized protein LOC106127679 isoform X1 [Papilio xuthus]|uniref:Uncharacterized protein LOC106127679 isoform X1 n=1 Tax=Papilio xuthus TaxID=66420 RepID=A0AAJ7EKV3_PAPXU|nr:PREDICTED: uncharacterized protein LOC106127679 isoform X1 [Papilio xuthus]XP_013181314.1 PREDICTED: uncharacterized protein LOC106127679 isoform X1 [Papilio xuthus]
MRKLTEDQTLQFIMLYKENSCLWDISSEDYKDRAMRQSALERICEGMQLQSLTVDDVKSKIKSIRSTYYLELDKIKKSLDSNASHVYEPKMKWFPEFHSFIKDVVVKRKPLEYFIDNSVFEHLEQSEDTTHGDSNVVASPAEPRRKRSRISKLSTIVSNVEEMQYDVPKTKIKTEEDEFDVFGKHVAKQLRELSLKQAILGQDEIQRVITKCRLRDLKYTNKKSYWKYRNTYNPEYIVDTQVSDDSTPGPSNICHVNIPLNMPESHLDMDSDDA